MPHPSINNTTSTACELVGSFDEAGQPLVAIVLKGTCDIQNNATLTLSPDPVPVALGGELQGDPLNPSYVYEPESSFTKLATDVVLIGAARPTQVPGTVADVGMKVGPLQKVLRVFGDRYWVKTGGTIVATRPLAFETIPLVYERAFGGWDKATKDEKHWRYDRRNPVGCGFGDPLRFVEEGRVRMPNLEDPSHLIRRYGDSPPPAGFGFVSPHWQARAQYAGTYDDAWNKQRKPLLPTDFDRRFFNAASPGLIATGYLRGDEDVVIVNASPIPQLRFRLPCLAPPTCAMRLRPHGSVVLKTNLDTVIVNTNEMRVYLLWRAFAHVANGLHDVAAVDISAENLTSRSRAG